LARSRLVVALLVAAAPALAQSSGPEEQARRLLEDGRTYRTEGKAKQALDNFNTIVTGFSGTESVDDALLEIGRYHLEVEGDDAKALQAFEQVAKRFPQSDGAPGAYYYLGRLALTRARTSAELDDALAQFNRVQRLYPTSTWVPQALHAAGLAHRKAGRLADAVESARRVAMEYPTSEAAAGAQFEVGEGLALLGDPRAAMEEFQQVRNRFPRSEWAPRALDRITALYRLHGSGKPAFALDSAFAAGSGELLKDVRAILMTPAGTLWIASDKVKSVVPVGPDGKLGPSVSAEEVRSLSLAPQGDLVVAAKAAVRMGARDIRTFSIPGDKPGEVEPVDRIDAAVVTMGGAVLVSDEKRKRVHRYDARYEYKADFPDAKEREVTRMLVDSEGGIVVLDRADRSVRVFDETGKLLRSLGPRSDMRKPLDVAVDAFQNVYVVDEDAGVLVLSPQGQLLATVGSQELSKPKALTVDPAGAILVYDEKAQRILRFK
jgi:outer membrane protein assembly factor BamD (BamD/ComL family)